MEVLANCQRTPKHRGIVGRDSTAVGIGGRSKEFMHLYTPREENPDGRELTRMARSAEGARAWSELFVRDTLLKRTTSLNDDPSSPKNAVVDKMTVQNNADAGVQSANVGMQTTGIQSADVGVQTAGIQSASVEVQTAKIQSVDVGGQNSASVVVPNSAGGAVLNNACTQNQVIMVGPKEKLPKFDGDGTADPIRHCKTCETIWMANGVTDTDEWV